MQPTSGIPVKADRPSILRGLLEIAGMMLPNSLEATLLWEMHIQLGMSERHRTKSKKSPRLNVLLQTFVVGAHCW